MKTGGFRHDIQGRDWPSLLDRYRKVAPADRPIAEMIASVIESGVSSDLGYATSHWDLIVTPLPYAAPPVDVVIVRGPTGLGKARPGHILVEHLPLVGLADSVERPASEAVPLFWRFMLDKYNITASARP